MWKRIFIYLFLENLYHIKATEKGGQKCCVQQAPPKTAVEGDEKQDF